MEALAGLLSHGVGPWIANDSVTKQLRLCNRNSVVCNTGIRIGNSYGSYT